MNPSIQIHRKFFSRGNPLNRRDAITVEVTSHSAEANWLAICPQKAQH
jgi:hypothetical protein